MPKQSLYVGELVPVQVKAYFPVGMSVSLDGLPQLSSDAFALSKLTEKPAQTEEMFNGRPYVVLTWDTAISGVKAGEYPLGLDLPVIARVRQKAARGARNPFKDFFGDDSPFPDSMFDDPIFDNFFGQVTEKAMTLKTDGEPVKIDALPADGRPVGFSGAVGDFEVSAQVSSSNATAGDPVSLTIKVTGKGNFDRVNVAGLSRSAVWKSYKQTVKFEPADGAADNGTKSFEQSVIPLQAGTAEIPELTFSYFNPDTGKYVTKQTEAIAVNVAPGDPTKVAASAASPDNDSAEAAAPTTGQSVAVRASPIASLQPLILRPWFVILNAFAFLALLGVALSRRLLACRSVDPRRLVKDAAEKSLRDSLSAMDAALQENNGGRFFEAARAAVQKRLAEHWLLPAKEITDGLISRRLNGQGVELRALFRTADEAVYCGRKFSPAELRRWRDTVAHQIQHIADL
jgi:hypothetical protein